MTNISTERLEEMHRGLEGVTPGPWTNDWTGDSPMGYVSSTAVGVLANCEAPVRYGDFPADPTTNAAHIAACDPDTIRSMIDELLAYRSSDKGEVVKPLEWGEWSQGGFIANMNGLLEYSIARGQVHWRVYVGKHHYLGAFDTLEEAKAAAQADYETRIRSALVSQSSPKGVEITEEMVERALNEYRLRVREYDTDFNRLDRTDEGFWQRKYGTNLHSTGLGEDRAMRLALEAAMKEA